MTESIREDYKKYYDIIDIIVNGTYGFVYKVKEKITNELRSIKVMDLNKIRKNFMNIYEEEEIKKQIKLCIDGFITEYNKMKICYNNNINSVKCYEYFNNENYFAIIMELCDIDLATLLLKKKKDKINKEEILDIMKQLNNTFKNYERKEYNIIQLECFQWKLFFIYVFVLLIIIRFKTITKLECFQCK